MNALSGSASKTDGWMVAFCAGMLDAIGVLGLVGLLDITGYLLKEGPMISSYPCCVTDFGFT